MKKIGITGGIGAGKSLAGKLLRSRGYQVLDADKAVHDLYRDCNELREKLSQAFGPECLTEGGVNRDFFVECVFSSKDIREKLEALVYPYLTREVEKFFAGETNASAGDTRGIPAKFVEAALFSRVPEIVEMLDGIWLVEAPEEVRLQRLVERGLNEQDARNRIENQRADFGMGTANSTGTCTPTFLGKPVTTLQNSSDRETFENTVDAALASL